MRERDRGRERATGKMEEVQRERGRKRREGERGRIRGIETVR